MPRLHHVPLRTVVSQTPSTRLATGGPTWKPSHPVPRGAIEPWFSLTPRGSAVDNRTVGAADEGVAATLETFGSVTGPSATFSGAGEAWPAVLGGQPVAPGTPGPTAEAEFLRHSHACVALDADGLGQGRQCLLLVAVRAVGPTERAAVQVFVGTEFVAEDQIHQEERIAVLVDIADNGRLRIDLRLRLVGGYDARLALLGVTGHRL